MARIKVAAKKKPKAKPSPPSPVTIAWLNTQFDQVDIANATILNRVEDVKKQCTLILAEVKKMQPSDNVTSELEAAITRNAALGRSIDRQVPDKKRK